MFRTVTPPPETAFNDWHDEGAVAGDPINALVLASKCYQLFHWWVWASLSHCSKKLSSLYKAEHNLPSLWWMPNTASRVFRPTMRTSRRFQQSATSNMRASLTHSASLHCGWIICCLIRPYIIRIFFKAENVIFLLLFIKPKFYYILMCQGFF